MISTEENSTRPNDQSSFLDKVMIAAPCNVGWENMKGTERVRFCAECKQNVYNTSLMSKNEIQQLLSGEGGTPCLRIYRRADGTLTTEDCPLGLRKIRDGWRRMSKVAASIWAVAVSLMPAWAQDKLPIGNGRIEGPRDINIFNVEPVVLDGKFYNLGRERAVSPRDMSGVPFENETGRQSVGSEGRADFHALFFYSKANAAIATKDFEVADKLFQEAVSQFDRSEHDPKFEEAVIKDYAAFLNSQHKGSQAEKLLEVWRQRNAANKGMREPKYSTIQILGGNPLYSSSERHQKSPPTLPEGAPIPDKE